MTTYKTDPGSRLPSQSTKGFLYIHQYIRKPPPRAPIEKSRTHPPLTIHLTKKLAILPTANPAVKQNPANDPLTSFSDSLISGFNDADEASIIPREEMYPLLAPKAKRMQK